MLDHNSVVAEYYLIPCNLLSTLLYNSYKAGSAHATWEKYFRIGSLLQLSNWINIWENPGFSTEYTGIISFVIPLVTASVSCFKCLLFHVYFCTLDEYQLFWVDPLVSLFHELIIQYFQLLIHYTSLVMVLQMGKQLLVVPPFIAMGCWHK